MEDIKVTSKVEFILDDSEIEIFDKIGSDSIAANIAGLFPDYHVSFGRNLGKRKSARGAIGKIYVENINPNPISVQSVIKEINKIFEGLISNHSQNPGTGTGAAVHGDRRGGGEEE